MLLNNPLQSCRREVLYDPLKVITLPTTSSSLCLPARSDQSVRQEKKYLSAENESSGKIVSRLWQTCKGTPFSPCFVFLFCGFVVKSINYCQHSFNSVIRKDMLLILGVVYLRATQKSKNVFKICQILYLQPISCHEYNDIHCNLHDTESIYLLWFVWLIDLMNVSTVSIKKSSDAAEWIRTSAALREARLLTGSIKFACSGASL